MLLRRDSIFCMENLNPCNIQRSLGEIRCLFCFVCLTLINFCLFVCLFLFLYMAFLKNGFWLVKQTPIYQGGQEAFGFESFICFLSDSNWSLLLPQTGGDMSFHKWVFFQFRLRRQSRSLFLPSCAGWCRSLLRCIRMCDVHLVCTYVHNYVKVLKIYFE